MMDEITKNLITILSNNNLFLLKQLEKTNNTIENIYKIISYQRIKRSQKGKKYVGKKQRHKILLRDDYTCIACGFKNDDHGDKNLHIDHITPKSKGGSFDDENLQVLCATCNWDKKTKTMIEFMEGG
jgi:5-methylcytosine-specific restriction endonuclease McrA